MDNLKDFLNKFKNLVDHSGDEKKIVAEATQKHTGVSVDPKNIQIKEGFVRIVAEPAIRSEIYMKKAKILADINVALKPKTFQDIR